MQGICLENVESLTLQLSTASAIVDSKWKYLSSNDYTRPKAWFTFLYDKNWCPNVFFLNLKLSRARTLSTLHLLLSAHFNNTYLLMYDDDDDDIVVVVVHTICMFYIACHLNPIYSIPHTQHNSKIIFKLTALTSEIIFFKQEQ